MQDQQEKYLTGPQVLARYQISEMTLHRWQNDERLMFPKPMVVRRRKFYKHAELIEWERSNSGAGR
jgi:predicted DNA-binding transcriptional regulator AlpA